MYIERPYGKENRTILCNVPPHLPGMTLSDPITFETKHNTPQSFGSFSLSNFMSRYMVGYKCLKEARLVS